MSKRNIQQKFDCGDNYVIWKESPGLAQQELERMFKNNLIGPMDMPNAVRQKNVLFLKHSPRNFAVHFRKTKAKMGLFLNNIEETSNTIPELGSGPSGETILTPKKYNVSGDLDEIEYEEDIIQFITPPCSVWTYMNHEMKSNFVVVAVPIISGSTDINFVVSENGLAVTISFVWPIAMFKPKELFYDEIHHKCADKRISADHPKIYALSCHLLAHGVTENSQPKGKIVIKLPIQVVCNVEGWSKKAVQKTDDTKIIILEFKAFQDKSIVKDTDTSIVFN